MTYFLTFFDFIVCDSHRQKDTNARASQRTVIGATSDCAEISDVVAYAEEMGIERPREEASRAGAALDDAA